MATKLLFIFLLIPVYAQTVSYDPLKIHQPSIDVVTEKNGYIGIESGYGGDIRITPGANDSGSVFLDGEDLLYIIQIVQSKPPVWENNVNQTAPYGYLGEFHAGRRIGIQLDATDPEGTDITYQRVAGDFPPGIRLFGTHNRMIGGVVPDADAMYSFTIRATDGHGKYADAAFRMVIRGADNCKTTPCTHEGVCVDDKGDVRCSCVSPYGGKTCNLNCRSNPLGIQQSLKYVSDSQMTAYKSYTSNTPWSARIGGSSYWYGQQTSDAYLQIDFGNQTEIHRIDTVRGSTYYYTQYFYIEHSVNGNDWQNYTSYTGSTERLTGSYSSSTYTQYLPTPLTTRFVRLHPLTWYSSSYYPAFKLEMYGCYIY